MVPLTYLQHSKVKFYRHTSKVELKNILISLDGSTLLRTVIHTITGYGYISQTLFSVNLKGENVFVPNENTINL